MALPVRCEGWDTKYDYFHLENLSIRLYSLLLLECTAFQTYFSDNLKDMKLLAQKTDFFLTIKMAVFFLSELFSTTFLLLFSDNLKFAHSLFK